ncbi:WD40-repeat-containing domain protein [Dichotomopilus funicola]|uniref:WD40-repeat-containing domain protein n=1 Tax=Dichotomopilus funicola TaxID=1934379 RepID=A0AAN6V6D6_9PEZI|nr:WD40-repeat-containing domain protein [Dichotomopilus funicola]
MYQLVNSGRYRYPGQEIYVTDILPVTAGFATAASDQSISLFDPPRLDQGPVKRIRTDHGNLTASKIYSAADSVVCTAGENGTVSLWDLRQATSSAPAMQIGGNLPGLLSLACSNETNTVAAGTELANHQASIIIWDLRTPSNPRAQYNEGHSDDITTLTYSPTHPSHLLSGSTDGLLNLTDTLVPDEDDAVLATFNHGSVHRAGFLVGTTEVFAASHDEKFALYDTADETPQRGAATLDLGDMRELLGCRYLADVVAKQGGDGAVVGVGAQDQEMFQLIHLSKGAEGWGLDKDTIVGLPGAHGSELVRSFCFYDEQQLVFTAGEDGCVKAWRPGS